MPLLAGQRVVVIDIETSGWSPSNDSVVELGCVTLEDGGIAETWSSLVQLGRPMPFGASRVHGIDDRMLAAAPSPGVVAKTFRERCGHGMLAIHNARFDLSFIAALLRRSGAAPVYNPVVDTLGLARGLYGHGGNSLAELTAKHGLSHEDAHRALGDARATALLLGTLAERWEAERGVLSLVELAAASQDAIRLTRKSGPRPAAVAGDQGDLEFRFDSPDEPA